MGPDADRPLGGVDLSVALSSSCTCCIRASGTVLFDLGYASRTG